MKRREFIDRLMRISEMNERINSLRNVPLFCCKKTKIIQRRNKRDRQQQAESILGNPFSEGQQDVFVYIGQKASNRLGSASKMRNGPIREGSGKRLRTAPSSISVKREENQSTGREISNFQQRKLCVEPSSNVSPKDTHYLQINAMQPQFVEPKRLMEKLLVSGKGGPKLKKSELPPKIKRHSFTHSCETGGQNDQKTGRALYTSNILDKKEVGVTAGSSMRPDSPKKYESMKEGVHENAAKSETERRFKIALRKEINQNYRRAFVPPPKMTARSYIIYEIKPKGEQSSVVISFNSKSSHEVASLTKIMTCILALQICRDHGVDRYCEQVQIGRMQSSVGGTTAALQEGQIYTIDQLLYGLMLPSGNDASLALAVWGGRKIIQRERETCILIQGADKKEEDCLKIQSTVSCCSSNGKSDLSKRSKTESYNRFIHQMNLKAKCLKMCKTNYANSHGLINANNKSSAYDLAILCEYAMRSDAFRKIVHSRSYKGVIKVSNKVVKRKSGEEMENEVQSCNFDEAVEGLEKKKKIVKKYSLAANEDTDNQGKNVTLRRMEIEWQNTHKLMQLRPKEYIGIKTGFTTTAGPCLASCLSVQNRQFVIIVLGCGRMSLRFKQTEILKRWLYKHENIKKLNKSEGERKEMEFQREEGVSEDKFSNILSELRAEKEIED